MENMNSRYRDTMIRTMQQTDIDTVVDIWLDASIIAHDFVAKEFWLAQVNDMKNIYLPNADTYLYENQDGVCGFCSLQGDIVAALFVRPAQQGKGIGRALLQKAMELCQHLQLTVYAVNTRSIAFYEKAGFHAVKEQHDRHTGQLEIVMTWSKK